MLKDTLVTTYTFSEFDELTEGEATIPINKVVVFLRIRVRAAVLTRRVFHALTGVIHQRIDQIFLTLGQLLWSHICRAAIGGQVTIDNGLRFIEEALEGFICLQVDRYIREVRGLRLEVVGVVGATNVAEADLLGLLFTFWSLEGYGVIAISVIRLDLGFEDTAGGREGLAFFL